MTKSGRINQFFRKYPKGKTGVRGEGGSGYKSSTSFLGFLSPASLVPTTREAEETELQNKVGDLTQMCELMVLQ